MVLDMIGWLDFMRLFTAGMLMVFFPRQLGVLFYRIASLFLPSNVPREIPGPTLKILSVAHAFLGAIFLVVGAILLVSEPPAHRLSEEVGVIEAALVGFYILGWLLILGRHWLTHQILSMITRLVESPRAPSQEMVYRARWVWIVLGFIMVIATTFEMARTGS